VEAVSSEAEEMATLMYMALRRLGCGDLATVRSTMGLGADEAEEAWRRLEALGLIKRGDTSGLYMTVDPDVALLGMVQAQRAHMESLAGASESIVRHFRPAVLQENLRVEVQLIEDRRHRNDYLRSLHVAARDDMWSMHPGPLPSADVLEASLRRDADLVARGVRVRAVYGHAVASRRQNRKYLAALAGLGAEVRLARLVPFDLLLFDAAAAVMPSDPEEPSAPMLVLQGSQLMGTYVAMFRDVWLRAAPFSHDGAVPEQRLTDKQQAVLTLLVNGLTDEQISRRLGISTRTVGRTVSEVMAQAGARTRFHAGVLAGASGMVSVADAS
jgi:DNA-binding NarL/FixJ family response regulator